MDVYQGWALPAKHISIAHETVADGGGLKAGANTVTKVQATLYWVTWGKPGKDGHRSQRFRSLQSLGRTHS